MSVAVAGGPAKSRMKSKGGLETAGDILLDAGTNEVEVLVFSLEGGDYGVNVAKVREVIRGVTPTETPRMHGSVLGMFNSRGTLVPLVDLKKHLGLGVVDASKLGDQRIIITEFNGVRVGFIVDSVEQIHRVSWGQIKEAPSLHDLGGRAASGQVSSTTGVLKMADAKRESGERLVLMVDFESVSDAIAMQDRLHVESVDNPDGVDRASKRVIVAEDSPFMRQVLQRVLTASGYTGLEVYANGQAAWERLEASLTDGSKAVDALISDIEMPQMDGLHLTKRVKDHPQLRHLPVVLFSSLVSADNIKKGRQVGATIQVPKPELSQMVRLVDRAVSGRLEEIEREMEASGRADAA